MFIIKAETRTDTYPQPFTLLTAERVYVRKPRPEQSDGVAPDIEIQLSDNNPAKFITLHVGHGLEHYSAVYIMNDRGKTVESVHPATKMARS